MLSLDNSPFTLQKADRTLSLKSQPRFKLQSYKVSRTSKKFDLEKLGHLQAF
jgi:hypothetical protein